MSTLTLNDKLDIVRSWLDSRDANTKLQFQLRTRKYITKCNSLFVDHNAVDFVLVDALRKIVTISSKPTQKTNELQRNNARSRTTHAKKRV